MLLVVGLAVGVGAGADEDRPEIEYGAFKQAFYDQVGGAIDAKLAEAEAKLAAGDLNPAERTRIEAEQAEWKRLKGRVEDVQTVEALYSSVKDGFSAVGDLAKEVETGYAGGSAVNLGSLTVKNLKQLDTLGKLSLASGAANTGYDYYTKVKALAGDLEAIDATELSPAAKRLSSSLTTMTALMAAFGDKVPLVGSFIKGYGDVGGGLLKATLALDQKLVAAEGGEMIDGVHGSRKEMLDKLHGKGIDSASRVEGLRDVYVAGDGRVLLWDPAAHDWAIASDAEPGITPAELTKRYLHYAKRGVKSPSVEQLLKGYTRTLVLTLTASATVVKPGDTVTLTVGAHRLKDDQPVTGAFYVTLTEEAHTGFGAGSFAGATTVRLGQEVRWSAPNNVNETYTIAAELAEETKQAANSTGPARVKLRTGTDTRVTVEAKPARVAAGGDVTLVARVTDGDGKPLAAETRGAITLTVAPAGGRMGSFQALADAKGMTQTWHAAAEPGRYTITARFDGAVAYGLTGTHAAGATGSVGVEVAPPEFELAVDAASRPAAKEAPAVFTVTLTNRDPSARRYELRAKLGPQAETAHWRRSSSGLTSPLAVEAGASQTLTFQLTPADDKATRLSGQVTAMPVGGGAAAAKHVSFTAVAKEAGGLKVSIVSSAKEGRASATKEAVLTAGARVPLEFQPWGPRREYCVREVMKRNAGMRMVRVFSHGPGGCSFGTDDGTMHAEWQVADEKITWSGDGVVAKPGARRAEFVVPSKPGRYTVSASGTASWKYERRTPAGVTRQAETETGSATFTITVAGP